MMNLGLNFRQVFKYLVPALIRGERFEAWIGALLQPVQTLNDGFVDAAATIRYFLRFDGRVIYLEHLLNDLFDNNLRRIYIDDPDTVQIITPYVFNKVEQQPPLTIFNKIEGEDDTVFLYTKYELGLPTDDFVVHVPTGIFDPTVETQMSFYIDKYRIAGKRYSFQTF